MTSLQLKPGYEHVFHVTGYHDSPLQGTAEFNGQSHFFEWIGDEVLELDSNLYQLTPIPRHILDLANEDWAIWSRWNYKTYNFYIPNLESYWALPENPERHWEIKAVLDSALKTDAEKCFIRTGYFERVRSWERVRPWWFFGPWQVKWTDPIFPSGPQKDG